MTHGHTDGDITGITTIIIPVRHRHRHRHGDIGLPRRHAGKTACVI